MRGRYLIRNPRSAAVFRVLDAGLHLLKEKQVRSVPVKPRRILVACWRHLGDVLLAFPTLQALRRAFPDAEIGLLAGSWSRHVVDGTSLYDRLHVVDHFILSRAPATRLQKIRRYLAMRRAVISEIAATAYDVAIDISPFFPPASPLFRASAIPVRAGFTSGGFGPLLTHPVCWVHASRAMSDYPRDLLAALWPDLHWPQDAFAPCYPGQPRAPLPAELAGSAYVVLHIGSGAAYKEWPDENWAAVTRGLSGAGHRLVIAGSGEREAKRAARLVGMLPRGAATPFVDRPWSEYVALIASAAHLVCLESSSAHIAAAFKVPTTAIYPGTGDPVQWAPVNPFARVLTAPVGCSPCFLNTGCSTMACLRGVTPAIVTAAMR